jgi:hypothetical protein
MTTMKTPILTLLIAGMLMMAPGAWSEERFVAGLGELPLMPGLKEYIARRLVYEKAGGRIVNAFATGTPTIERIRNFYHEILPQLGWQPLSETVFRREQEILSLRIITLPSGREVQYKIAPE